MKLIMLLKITNKCNVKSKNVMILTVQDGGRCIQMADSVSRGKNEGSGPTYSCWRVPHSQNPV